MYKDPCTLALETDKKIMKMIYDPTLMSDFHNYVLAFYGENGIYKIGATLDMVMEATQKYINSSDEFYGDSFDREHVRDIMIKDYGLKMV